MNTIVSADHFFDTGPKLAKLFQTRFQNVGTNFKSHCVLDEGSLPVSFEWLKNNIPLSSIDKVSIETDGQESMLTVSRLNLEDSGNYTCRANNDFGFDLQSTMLMVKGSSC